MKSFIHRFATPLTTGLFIVSLISGVALFFHWTPGVFHGMHEWLSIVLILPFALHMWKNWNALVAYARRGTLLLPLAASLLVALPFAVNALKAGNTGGNPAMRTMRLMTQARLSDLAPLLKTSPDALVSRLRQLGYAVVSADQTLDKIAASAGVPASGMLLALMPAAPAR